MKEGFKNQEIPEGWGGGVIINPPGTEIPRGWGAKINKTFHGAGVWIFSGTAQCKKTGISQNYAQ